MENEELERDEYSEEDDSIDDDQAMMMDEIVSKAFADGLISYGYGFELKCAVIKNDADAEATINSIFNERDSKGLMVIRSIQDTIVTDKSIFIWYYE